MNCTARFKAVRRASFGGTLLAVSFLYQPHAAQAIQPLSDFLQAATHHNYDTQQATFFAQQRAAEARAATAHLLPNLALTGTYTRNEYAAQFPIGDRLLSILKLDQLDAAATLTVPVFDLTSWAKRSVAHNVSQATRSQQTIREIEVAKQVAQQYYNLRGQEGVLESARKSYDITQRNLRLAQDRLASGIASTLDTARAESDLAEALQQIAGAELQVTLARRALETLTGVVPEPAGPLPEVALDDEPAIETWLSHVTPKLPAVAEVRAQERAQRAGDRAAKYGYLPTFDITASERVTNASALNGGHTAVWTAKANVSWKLDAAITPTQRAQALAARSAQVRSEQVLRQVADTIYNDYAQVRANQASSRAARARVAATKLAERLAVDKAAAGIITQIDLSQARRDAFAAEIARIQADANLLFYRSLLRLDSSLSAAAFEEPL